MTDYMDTPHYRVNKFAAAVRVLRDRADTAKYDQPIYELNGIRLMLDDLEAVVQESAHLFTGESAARVERSSVRVYRVEDRLPTHNYSVLGLITEGPFISEGVDEPYWEVCAYITEHVTTPPGWYAWDKDRDVLVKVSHWCDLPWCPEDHAPTYIDAAQVAGSPSPERSPLTPFHPDAPISQPYRNQGPAEEPVVQRLGPHPDDLRIIWYEDAEKPPEVFYGPGAEAAAEARFKSARDNWTCHLLVHACPTDPPENVLSIPTSPPKMERP